MTIMFMMAVLELTSLGGSAARQRIEPLPPTFLEGAPQESRIERVPFEQAWAASDALKTPVSAIFVKPVRTDLLPPETWRDSTGVSITSSGDFQKLVDELGAYFHEQLVAELRKAHQGNPRLKVVSAPASDSVNLEVAFTEMVLSRPVARAAAMAAPVPGLEFALSAMSEPHVAFAARFTSPDGATLLGTVADRRFPPMRPIDLNKLTVSSSAREIVSQWARELAEAIEFDRLTPVERSSRFSLLPW
jgi:hypothetical protein